MNRELFHKFLENDVSLSAQTLAQLQVVIDRFPYFQGGIHLAARGHLQLGTLDADAYVKRAAVHASQRAYLKHWFANAQAPAPSVSGKVSSSEQTREMQEISEISNTTVEKLSVPTEITMDSHALLEGKTVNEHNNKKFYVHTEAFGKKLQVTSDDIIEAYLAYRSAPKVTSATEPTQDKFAIIQKFIETNPSISRFAVADVEPEQKEDLSARSTSEDVELVSETLAKLYIKQEKFKKAIEIFEKLMLKYPEKSTLFASQIQQIKSKSK